MGLCIFEHTCKHLKFDHTQTSVKILIFISSKRSQIFFGVGIFYVNTIVSNKNHDQIAFQSGIAIINILTPSHQQLKLLFYAIIRYKFCNISTWNC